MVGGARLKQHVNYNISCDSAHDHAKACCEQCICVRNCCGFRAEGMTLFLLRSRWHNARAAEVELRYGRRPIGRGAKADTRLPQGRLSVHPADGARSC